MVGIEFLLIIIDDFLNIFHVSRQRSLTNGKTSRRAGGPSSRSPSLATSKRGSERKRNSATMVLVFSCM